MNQIENNHSPCLPSISLPHLCSQLKQLCHKIWQAVCSFFSQLSKIFETAHSFFFTPREITLLRDHPIQRQAPPGQQATAQDLSDRKVEPIQPANDSKSTTSDNTPRYTTFDPSLEEFRLFMRDFSSLLVDILHEKQLAGTIKEIQNKAPTIPPIIKSIAKLLIEMGDRAAKPLFQRFSKQKSQVIDPALQMIFKTLLKGLSEAGDENKVLHSSLKNELLATIKTPPLQKGQQLETHYIEPILGWLLHSDHTLPIRDLFLPAENYKEDLIDKVMEHALTLLVEKKIDYYADQLQTLLQDRLDSIVLKTLQINAGRFSDFLSERFSDLVSNMPFAETFDAVAKDVIGEQIQGYIKAAADPQLLMEKNILEKAKKAVQVKAKTSEEEENKQRAENHLKAIALQGGEKAYIEQRFLEAFSKQIVCTPQIHQIIQQQSKLINQLKNPQNARKASENAIFSGIAERLLTLMLPVQKKVDENGVVEEIQPLEELWNRLYLPPEFYQLFAHVEELASEFITPETIAMFAQIKGPLLEWMKGIFQATLKDVLRKRLLSLVQIAIEKITVPALLDKLMAENILPALNRQLVKQFLGQEFGLNIPTLSPLFHQLMKSDNSSSKTNKEKLENALIEIATKKFNNFKPSNFHAVEEKTAEGSTLNYQPASEEELRALISPIIDHYQQLMPEASINGVSFDPASASVKDVEEVLKKLYQASETQSDPFYGELASDLFFRLGEFPMEGFIGPIFKDKMSAILTAAFSDMRASHHYLIDLMTTGLKETFLDKQYMSELMSDQPPPASPHVRQKLSHQMHMTASLAHDLLMRKAESWGTAYKYMAKMALTDSPNKLETTIAQIYRHLFSRETLNQNAIVRTIDELFASFSIAALKIQNRDNLLLYQRALNLT